MTGGRGCGGEEKGGKKGRWKEGRRKRRERKEKQDLWNFPSIKSKKLGILRLSAESKPTVIWLGHYGHTLFFLPS